MNLINVELEQRFAEVGPQRDNPNPLAIARFYDPVGSSVWYATEYDPDELCFYGCLVEDNHHQWAKFTRKELHFTKRPYAIGVERDPYFNEQPISEAVPELKIEMERQWATKADSLDKIRERGQQNIDLDQER